VPPAKRARRDRADIRQILLDSALVEFGAKGFDGASTRSIARRADAHQPQLAYHFATKEALWFAAVDHLFALLQERLADLDLPPAADAEPAVVARTFAEGVRRFVRFAAEHPELNQIMVHEGAANSERLRWLVDRHTRPIHDAVVAAWAILRDAGVTAPVHEAFIHHVIVGAASLPYVTRPEVALLAGIDPTEPAWVEAHAEGIVTMLLPGLARG
jgi:TetR/AcrR family transcriptional regulator